MKVKKFPTFGQVVRAMRLGWRWSSEHECFIRVATLSDSLFLIEVHPGLVPNKVQTEFYTCWWEIENFFDMCEPLKERKIYTNHCMFYLNENGDILRYVENKTSKV